MNLVLKGEVNEAILYLNKYDTLILEKDQNLYFYLQKQNLIELIRKNEINNALEFVQNHLAPLAGVSQLYLADLEKVMTLIICGNSINNNDDNIDLFSNNQRIITANILNRSLLK